MVMHAEHWVWGGLDSCGGLSLLWSEQNPDGALWIERLTSDDVRRPLDYAGKSAKRDRALFDNCIILPFA